MQKIHLFLGHHKGGTRYVGNIIQDFGVRTGVCTIPLSNPKWFQFDLRSAIEGLGRPALINYMNADYAFVRRLTRYRAFHIVRDPRDMAVSAYYSHLYSHSTEWWPELKDHRDRLRKLNFCDGLICDMEFTDTLPTDGYAIGVFNRINSWRFDDPNILELKFEHLISSPLETLYDAFRFVGLLGDEPSERMSALQAAIEANSFERLSGGRQAGQRDDHHHYRSGRPGEWRTAFQSVHVNWFKSRYPGILPRLGYENDVAW
jgi:hypothetical protein